jgi:hypothetical protein
VRHSFIIHNNTPADQDHITTPQRVTSSRCEQPPSHTRAEAVSGDDGAAQHSRGGGGRGGRVGGGVRVAHFLKKPGAGCEVTLLDIVRSDLEPLGGLKLPKSTLSSIDFRYADSASHLRE